MTDGEHVRYYKMVLLLRYVYFKVNFEKKKENRNFAKTKGSWKAFDNIKLSKFLSTFQLRLKIPNLNKIFLTWVFIW